MAANPMTQFEVYRIGPEIKVGAFDISFTNASLFMVVSSLTILVIFNFIHLVKNSSIMKKFVLVGSSYPLTQLRHLISMVGSLQLQMSTQPPTQITK